jgi:Tfp pilus assembly protein PilO
MIMLQAVPPTPPSPPFDPNLIFLTGGPPLVIMIVVAALTATTIILWPIVRAFARRLEGKAADPALKAEVEHLQARLAEVDGLQARVTELEERVDFTERLLAQSREPDRLQR